MTRSQWGVKLDWDPKTGWGFVFSTLGVNLVKIGLAAAITTAGAAGSVGLAGVSAYIISQVLYNWAFSASPGAIVTTEAIIADREQEGLDADRAYVAICGPSGSGKSSLINALRGLLNRDTDAASVGTTETTRQRQEYQAAACFDDLTLVDFPGAGTQRVPSQGYFNTNKLHCYDYILVICGERFGEIEIALVQACIVQGKRFAIVRSRSDEAIRRVEDDTSLPLDEAKLSYIHDETSAITEELRRASLPEESIVELLGFFILVNKNTLRRLTTMPPYDWPSAFCQDEIHERKLLQLLGKAGVADEHVNLGAESE
ncbi:interferon-inducible GTPase (IIGP) domain-containing [Fusarium albosuccineum]|uniref:Interferon-inducible GTPase (IIGP) domain-containing n=1 Tax=Fusarium albosuccineum TaxID=1237068 RepID=A0A8H4L8W4_9HYPO|nr:interferon-inducible GTPase (IIGP) domain-containing [Fusarium albosuccineum]